MLADAEKAAYQKEMKTVQTQREVEFRESIPSFNYFSMFVWSFYYVPATVLGARDVTMNKAKSLFSWSLFLYWEIDSKYAQCTNYISLGDKTVGIKIKPLWSLKAMGEVLLG